MRVRLAIAAVLVAACGQEVVEIPFASAADITAEEEACLDFYRSIYASTEEEPVYYRRLAEEIGALGHPEAAAALVDVAEVWEGEGSGEETEESISAQLAEAGGVLADDGNIRCADLAEAWGIDGYDGEPDPQAIFERQRSIWLANGVDDYFLLVGQLTEDDLVQHFVQVIDGVVDRVFDEAGDEERIENLDVPLTVTDLYGYMDRNEVYATRYDLVNAVPTRFGDFIVDFDLGALPSPIDEFSGEEAD